MATEDDSNDIWESIGISPSELPESARGKPRPLYGGETPSEVPADVDLSQFQEIPDYQEPEEQVQYAQQQPLSEVEKRLQKAVLYQTWANGGLYTNPNESAIEVEQEFKEFALNQLNKLIGLPTQETKQELFDNNEVLVLKALVRAVIENKDLRMSLLGGLSKPPKPTKQDKPATTVKKSPGRPTKAVNPVVKAPATKPAVVAKNPPKPQLKVQEVPQELKPPVAQAQPVQVARPVAMQPVAKQDKPLVMPDGTEFEENGRKYKCAWVLTTTGVLGPAKEIKLQKMPPKTAFKVDDVTIYKTEGNEIYKIIKQDITPKETPVNGVPFPSTAGMSAITLARASQAAESGQSVLARKLGK